MTFRLALLAPLCCSLVILPRAPAFADGAASVDKPGKAQQRIDRSGKARKGKASYYARRFAGRKMANGERMNPGSNAAASRTLPLGTRAKVTNLRNGKSADVEIKDRGPYVQGRTIDLTPQTAESLGMKHEGVAPVEVAPIEVPQPDGTMKAGEAAAQNES